MSTYQRKRQNEEEEEDQVAKFMRMNEEENDEKQAYVPVAKRREMRDKQYSKPVEVAAVSESSSDNNEEETETETAVVEEKVAEQKSLLLRAAELRKSQTGVDKAAYKQQQQMYSESMLLKEASQVQTNALQSSSEIAEGVRFAESLKASWRPPAYIRERTEEQNQDIRNKWHIIVEGQDVAPPIKSFKEMKLPQCFLSALQKKGINRPTPIQVQACPVLLTGRDVIGIAFTGSGKTLTFALPMIMFSLEEEMNMPLVGGEGPIGLVLCPSRELARQTYEVIEGFLESFVEGGYPKLRSALCIGGESNHQLCDDAKAYGLHCLVATPGRLNDHLNKERLNMNICKYMVLDEADRM
jgi:ATP-dependent RNA helicase DDX41